MDSGFLKVTEVVGSRYRLAQILGITKNAIYKWGDEIPPQWVERVSEVTGVPLLELRPETREALRIERLNWPPMAVENKE